MCTFVSKCDLLVSLWLDISRAHSPGIAVPSFSGTQRFNMSCHTPSPRGHSILASPNSTLNDTALLPEMEPILPDLCIEQLWTETSAISRSAEFCYAESMKLLLMFVLKSVLYPCYREKGCQASKVFITSDLCENRYLCFLVESHQQLRWMCVLFIYFASTIMGKTFFAFLLLNFF